MSTEPDKDILSALRSRLSGEILRFAIVGLVATLTHALVLSASVEGLNLNPVLGTTCAFIVAAFVTYFGQSAWVFGVKDHSPGRLASFLSVAATGLLANIAIMALAIKVLHLHYLVAFASATVLVPAGTFLANKFWVFRTLKSGHEPE